MNRRLTRIVLDIIEEFLEDRQQKLQLEHICSLSQKLNSVQHTGTGALLIVNNYTFDLIWGLDSIYLFDLHSKDEKGNLSATAVLLKFDNWYSLENYIRYFIVILTQ